MPSLQLRPDRRPPRQVVALAVSVVTVTLVMVVLLAGQPSGNPGGERAVAGAGSGAETSSSLAGAATNASAASPGTTSRASVPKSGKVLVARARTFRSVPNPSRIVPRPSAAHRDVPAAYSDGCHVSQPSSIARRCVYGYPKGRTTVALVGDSKALQWLPALQVIAARRHWRIELYTKSACAFARGITMWMNGRPYTACRTWNARVAARLAADPPDIVLTSNGRRAVLSSSGKVTGTPALATGLRRAWAALDRAGSTVLVLRDTPSPGREVPACVTRNRTDVRKCGYSRAKGLAASSGAAQLLALRSAPSVTLIDMTPQLCPRSPCQPVLNGVLAYRQGSHLTATFIRGMSRELERLVLRAAPVARRS